MHAWRGTTVRRRFAALVATLLCAAASESTVASQTRPVGELTREPALTAEQPQRVDLAAAARQIIRGAEYAALMTVDAKGAPQARTVQPLPPDRAWVVWFATNPRTRKVAEIAREPRVVLHYFDRSTLSYVSLIGRATVITDRATKNAHWHASWNAFYPDRDTSVVLIRVVPERLEIVSSTLGIAGDAATWRPPTLTLPPASRR